MALHTIETMASNGESISIPAAAGSLPQFRAWAHSDSFPKRGRISLINNAIHIDMSPEELENHNKVKQAIDVGVGRVNQRDDRGEHFVDGVLLTNAVASLATVPDGLFVTWATSASGRVQFVQRKNRHGEFVEMRGTPDWVFEAVSFSSVKKDTLELPVAYHRAGIGEFWLIDARGQDIDFQILLRGREEYRPSKSRSGWLYSPLFERWFRLTRRINRAGRWSYKLEFKSK